MAARMFHSMVVRAGASRINPRRSFIAWRWTTIFPTTSMARNRTILRSASPAALAAAALPAKIGSTLVAENRDGLILGQRIQGMFLPVHREAVLLSAVVTPINYETAIPI